MNEHGNIHLVVSVSSSLSMSMRILSFKSTNSVKVVKLSHEGSPGTLNRLQCIVGQSPKGMMVFIYIGHLSGLQGVEMCAGLLQSVPMGAAECVQGYRVCAGCSFNILPCSSRLNQKIFY